MILRKLFITITVVNVLIVYINSTVNSVFSVLVPLNSREISSLLLMLSEFNGSEKSKMTVAGSTPCHYI